MMFASLLGLATTSCYVSEKNEKSFLSLENTYCDLTLLWIGIFFMPNWIQIPLFIIFMPSRSGSYPMFYTRSAHFFYFYHSNASYTVLSFSSLSYPVGHRVFPDRSENFSGGWDRNKNFICICDAHFTVIVVSHAGNAQLWFYGTIYGTGI